MALYKDTNLTLYEVKHCVSGTCKANTRQWIHKLKLTCACDHPNITSHIFRHPCHHSRRPRVVRDWNHPIYMGLWPGAHFWGQGGGGAIFLKVSQAQIGSHLACALADWESGRDDALVQLKSESLKLLGDFASPGRHIPLLMSDVNEGLFWIKELLTSPGSFIRSKSCRLWGWICLNDVYFTVKA